jgi:hypothetical protein
LISPCEIGLREDGSAELFRSIAVPIRVLQRVLLRKMTRPDETEESDAPTDVESASSGCKMDYKLSTINRLLLEGLLTLRWHVNA